MLISSCSYPNDAVIFWDIRMTVWVLLRIKVETAGAERYRFGLASEKIVSGTQKTINKVVNMRIFVIIDNNAAV
jgi:hypothetical protein